MAISPLFVSDLDLLKSKLRLSGAQEGDATEVIEQAVRDARYFLYDQLGSSLVEELVAIPSSDTPSTENELRRTLAESTETLIVRVELMRVLPTLFLDSAGSAHKAWNEEGITRDSGRGDVRRYIKETTSRIRSNIAKLTGSESSGEVQGGVLEPSDDQLLRPFDTIKRSS